MFSPIVQGAPSHFQRPLAGSNPAYAHLHFLDPQEALGIRLSQHPRLERHNDTLRIGFLLVIRILSTNFIFALVMFSNNVRLLSFYV